MGFLHLVWRLGGSYWLAKGVRKIIFVINNFGIGGTERHLLGLIPRLKMYFHINVFLLETGMVIEDGFDDLKLKNPKAVSSKPINRFQIIFNLSSLLLKNRSAIVHFFLPEPYIIGGITSIFFGMPNLIMSRRSLNIYQQKYKFINQIEKLLHKKMHSVVANSNAVVNDLISEGIATQKVKLIYNPVEACAIYGPSRRNKKRAQFGLGKNDFSIVCVANLFHYKGHCDLVNALAYVSKSLPNNWKLILVGRDGGSEKQVKELVDRKNMNANIMFAGELENILEDLSIFDIGVLASHQEGFSNSVIEGMASGLPMIVTDVGGNMEAVDDQVNGLVVPAYNPIALGNAILRLAQNRGLREEYGRAARLKALKKFTWEACIKKYIQLYNQEFK